jgi:hypothetical protein
MECNETGMNAMHADIQAMDDGEATTAMKEMKMAEDMMAKKDMKAGATTCTTQWRPRRSRCTSRSIHEG